MQVIVRSWLDLRKLFMQVIVMSWLFTHRVKAIFSLGGCQAAVEH